MRNLIVAILLAFVAAVLYSCGSDNGSTRQERRLIKEGNAFYRDSDYLSAVELYDSAVQNNHLSKEGIYNSAMANIRIAETLPDSLQNREELMNARLSLGSKSLEGVAKSEIPLASQANYNLGNLVYTYDGKDLSIPINYYKQALRINPKNEDARFNLAVLLKKQQDQQQDQNQQDQQQNQDQDQDKQDQNQDKQQDQQQQQQQQQQDQQQQQQQDNQINSQTANRIMQAIEDKENAVRNSSGVFSPEMQKNHKQNRPSRRKNW